MIRFRLADNLIVSLESDRPNRSALIQYDHPEPNYREYVRWKLTQQYGAFGHSIGESTTPIDLHAAMLSPGMQRFRPELIEGAELVTTYDPGIPPGAKT